MVTIDAHTHLGNCKIFGIDISEDELIQGMDKYHVDLSIVQPHPGEDHPEKVHDDIAALVEKYPGRFSGLISMNPNMDRKRYTDEVERCITKLKFVGIKLHTFGHITSPISTNADIVFEMAEAFNVPVMIHTGPGVPFSLPSLAIPRAREYPTVSIVLAHSGAITFVSEAYVAAKECENIYLETSWCGAHRIKWLVAELGARKVMFGSDLPSNLPVEITKYETIGFTKEQARLCRGGNAARIFNLKVKV
ncbi:MAG: amidohydrolase [FCB group bacterium]|nr:amidohydrolase [FCB group bacterium]